MELNPSVRRTVACLLFLLPPAAVVIAWLSLRHGLGDQIATHFGLGGKANGFNAPGPYTLVVVIVIVLAAALGITLSIVDRAWASARVRCGVVAGISALVAGSYVDTLTTSHGLADVHAAHSGLLHTATVLVIGAGFGLAVARVLPPGVSTVVAPPTGAPAYRLGADERAVWVGSARSTRLLGVGIALLVAGALVLLVEHGPYGVVLLVVAFAMVWTHSVSVRVDVSGIRAHFGGIAWPVVRTPLDRIVAASAEEISPMRWGGWGYRISRQGTAMVVRRGPGLVISRANRPDLAITVDHPEGGADLINALVARRG